MKGCVRALAAGLGLAAVLAVFAAAPALAFWIKSPAFLAKSTLNGATVRVTTGTGASDYFSTASFSNTGFWTLSGVPTGATVTVSSVADGGNYRFTNSPRDAVLTLSFSGDFTADWALGIYGDFSLFNLADSGQSFGTIPVRVSSGAGLRVGSVSGQATEAGGTATFPVRLWTQPSAAVTVSVSSLNTGEGTVEPASLVFTGGSSGNWNTAQTVTVTGVDDNVDDETVTWQVRLDPSSGDTGYNGLANLDKSVTTTDDDATAMATLALNPASITEDGGISTVTARLSRPTNVATTLTVSTAAVSPAVSGDFTQSGTILTVAAGATTSTGLVTVTAVDNSVGAANKSVTVSATASGGRGVAAPSDATLTITDDDFGLDVGSVSGQATETGGTATFTVALQTRPTAAVTVSVSSLDAGEGTASPSVLTFAPSAWNTAQTVTVTGANDNVDDGTVTWQVRLDPSSGDTNYNGLANVDVDVTTTDDDGAPGVTLSLNPSSIAESGTGNAATVSARLSHPSGAATTLTVTAVSGVFTAGSGAAGTIVIPAGQTTAASDTALVTAVDNDTDAPDRTATVTATVTNARASADSTTMTVTGASLTVRDDDAAPGAVLFVAPASVSENGGTATVAAVLSRPSSEPSTVTVTAVSGSYTVGTAATLTIAAGSTVTTDTALVTAVDDAIHQGTPGRSVTVSGALANGQGAGAVTGASLTLTDDETLPTVALVLDPASISEEGGISTVTATLSGPSSAAATVTVAAAAGTGAVAADFDLSTATALTIAAGATTSAGVVTVTANGNAVASGSKSVTVSGTSSGGNSVANPPAATLTITDDDAPQPTLALSSNSIAENGGIATVTATLDRQSAVAVTVTVAAAPVASSGAVAGDFTLSTAAALTFAANATTSTGLVTVTAVNNTTDAPNKRVTVSGTPSDSLGLANTPPSVTLAITDDDAAPGVTLALNPASIAEPNGVSTVSATLSHPSSEPSTVTVTPVSGAYTAGTDATIVIAAGATTAASDTALIVAVDDDLHHGSAGRSATVTGALTNGQGAGAVTGAALTITDDETLPVASLVFSSSSISENGGVATITAALSGLSGKSSEATTVTVAVAAVATSGAVSGDFTLSTATTLTVAAGATTSTGLVTVTAVDNNLDIGTAQKQLRVTGTTAGGNGIQNPVLSLLLIDDDDAAAATLVLTPSAILENGGISTVTATLSHPTTEAATLTVATTAVSPAVSGDFTRAGNTLTIAANATVSAGLVTITAVDNNAATGNKQVRVSASASGGRGVSAPSVATLILRDDEFGLDLGPVMGQATEAGGRATFTVALLTQPSAPVTVSVSSRDAGEGTVSPSSLVFTTGNWNAARTVTARGVDDSIDDGTVTWQVRLDPMSGDADYDGIDEDVDVTTTDDDGTPTARLVLLPSSIGENGGVSTVTAELSHGSGAAVTVTVSTAAVSPAVAGDYTQAGTTLTIAAAATSSAGLVTVTAVNNAVVSPDKRVTVSATVAGGFATPSAPAAATLTIENDDEGGLALPSDVVTPTAGGAAAVYTVALTRAPADAVTVSVTRDNSDVRVDPSSLTFTMGNWNVAQPVTVTAALDTDEVADAATLAHAASGGGYDGVTGTVAVAVDDRRVTGIPLGGAAVAGTKTYRVNRQLVTVTWPEAESVREDVVVFDLTGIDRAVEVTFAELSEGGAGAGYSLGPSAASRVALDIEVSPVPTGGLRQLCLRVPDGLREAARGRGLVLLRNGEPVAGSRDDPPNKRVCAAGVSSFSPFAVGYEDTSPVFPEFTMTSMVFTVNQAVETDPLPLAVGGDGTEHRLSPARLVERLEAVGVEFDRARRVFSGTPTKAFAEEEFTWTATDVDGDEAEPLKFTIAVKAALDDARARLTAINKSVLPELSRAMWGSALDAVTGRLGGVGVPGAGGSAGLAGGLAAVDALLRANADKLEDGRASLRELVSGRRVALRLGASGSGESGAPGSQGAVVWMSGDWRKLSRKQAGLDWSGDLFAAHVGADAALGPRLRGGIAASRYASAVTYTDGNPRTVESVGAAVVGVHRTRMTTATPYIGVTGDRARAWAALGLGGGRVEIDDAEVVNQRLGEQSSGARFAAAALGGSARLSSGGSVEVRVKASGETSRFTVRGNGEEGAIAPLAATAQRLRLSAEGSRTWALSSGAELTPALEVGGRWDGGGGVTGAGIEIGGGVVWSDPGAGLTMEARARALVAHRGGAREHGVSAAVRLEPGARGRGLSLSLSPSWGKAESGMERLWRTGAPAEEAKPRSAPRLEAELGYGVAALGGSATLTPYGGFGIGEDGERRWRLGGRLELGPTFGLRLEAGRRDSPTTRPDNSIKLTLDARW